jgi:hypothetical protein
MEYATAQIARVGMTDQGEIYVSGATDGLIVKIGLNLIGELGLFDEMRPGFTWERDSELMAELVVFGLEGMNYHASSYSQESLLRRHIHWLCEPGGMSGTEEDRYTVELVPIVVQEVGGLSRDRWDAIVAAENRLYSDSHGAHAFTSVHYFEDIGTTTLVSSLWNHAEMHVDNDHDLDEYSSTDPRRGKIIQVRTAKRVADALAVLAFGSDMLLR